MFFERYDSICEVFVKVAELVWLHCGFYFQVHISRPTPRYNKSQLVTLDTYNYYACGNSEKRTVISFQYVSHASHSLYPRCSSLTEERRGSVWRLGLLWHFILIIDSNSMRTIILTKSQLNSYYSKHKQNLHEIWTI